jgi:hypothetical protein
VTSTVPPVIGAGRVGTAFGNSEAGVNGGLISSTSVSPPGRAPGSKAVFLDRDTFKNQPPGALNANRTKMTFVGAFTPNA